MCKITGKTNAIPQKDRSHSIVIAINTDVNKPASENRNK